ncbi:MAG: hypothetical protein U0807_14495 [Candidatus Binatia bacterium]
MRDVVALAIGVMLLGAGGVARANEEQPQQFRTTLVANSGGSDLAIDPTAGSELAVEAEDGGELKLRVAGVTDASGAPAQSAANTLTIVGRLGGERFRKSFSFDVVAGEGRLRDTLGLDAGAVLEVQEVTLATPAGGVFAVPGVGLPAVQQPEGNPRVARCETGGAFEASLVPDADDGDYAVDPARSRVAISGGDGGAVQLALGGVTDAGGTPVSKPDNRLVIEGTLNGAPFSRTFVFELSEGSTWLGESLGLAEGDVLEIGSVAVDDGAEVFAVPGLVVSDQSDDDGEHQDGDGDGVSDDGDACSETPADSVVSPSGCGVSEVCGCSLGHAALRSCVRAASKEIHRRARARCRHGASCRGLAREIGAARRQAVRTCRP